MSTKPQTPVGRIGSPYGNVRGRVIGIVVTGVWLLYLIGAVADLLTNRYSWPYIAGGLAIIVVFCVLYLALVPFWPTSTGNDKWPGLLGLALLAAMYCVFYGQTGGSGLWIFVASASGLLVTDRRWAVRAILGCIACFIVFSWTDHDKGTDFLSNLLPVVFLGFAMMGLRHLVQVTRELHRAREEVVQLAASEERLRLARDMHDLTGQSLSTITLKSELAGRLLGRLSASPERDRVSDEVEQVAAVSRQTLKDIREAIGGYRRPTLAVEIITGRSALASAGISTRDDPELTMLSGTFGPDAEAALAWCLREAITNVIRHSGASYCRIALNRHGKSLSLTVRDDGSGHVTGAGAPGSGLHGISERLSAVGGHLELRPDEKPGFCLVATVPAGVAEPAAQAAPAPARRPGAAAQAGVTE